MSYSRRLIERLYLLEAEMEDKKSKFSLEEIDVLLPGIRFAISALRMLEELDKENA